jgi:hypothetical protein
MCALLTILGIEVFQPTKDLVRSLFSRTLSCLLILLQIHHTARHIKSTILGIEVLQPTKDLVRSPRALLSPISHLTSSYLTCHLISHRMKRESSPHPLSRLSPLIYHLSPHLTSSLVSSHLIASHLTPSPYLSSHLTSHHL